MKTPKFEIGKRIIAFARDGSYHSELTVVSQEEYVKNTPWNRFMVGGKEGVIVFGKSDHDTYHYWHVKDLDRGFKVMLKSEYEKEKLLKSEVDEWLK